MNIKRLKQASLSDKQTWESKWKIDSPQAIAVHKAVMNVILTDMQPLSIVEDEGRKYSAEASASASASVAFIKYSASAE